VAIVGRVTGVDETVFSRGRRDKEMAEDLDKWASWLLHRRDGDDPDQKQKALEHLIPIRDPVLDNARLVPGQTLLDLGAGDGLIGFGAGSIA
jgi:hypothetical protein